PPAETFSDLAGAPDAWFAAVGSRGRNAVARVLLGNFADRVVRVCRKPVLVVR
ncbi:MAG: universal stress protein, partial [Deltaproteobacteria bacterium]|nr:universal stress protein [Deltaproteobacteria bacterium]